MDYTEIFTKDAARRIYNDLMENNSGQLPYPDFKLIYSLSKRNENKKPAEVDIELVDENDNKIDSYIMKYEDSFSDYRVIQGIRIVKR